MIGISTFSIFDLLLPALLIWATAKSMPHAKPLWLLSAMRKGQWTIGDWFDVTFWIAVGARDFWGTLAALIAVPWPRDSAAGRISECDTWRFEAIWSEY
jgi:hypothetical protein